MKKVFITVLFFIGCIPGFSQTGDEINSEGNAKMKVKPDLAVFTIIVEKENPAEKTAIKNLNEEIEKVQNLLLKIGFTEKHIKISDYKVSSNENDDNTKEYTASNSLVVTFPLDNKLIDAFYQQIQAEDIKDADIQFESQISEELEKKTRQKLVQQAIADAKSNAENIARALDVKIGAVKQVSKYNVMRDMVVAASLKADSVKFSKPMVAMWAKTSFDKFEVEGVALEESISIVYEIVKK